jgi:NADPH:quinone reductase-like Zn-dependent oxidoreductase
MDAIQLEAKGGLAIFVNNHHTPAVPKDCLLVRTLAVRLNPHELLAIYPPWSFSEPGNLLGYDYAGVVEEVRPEVKSNFKKGDGVCGCTRPILCSPTRGTFATYVVVVVNVQLHIPDELSFENAASLSVSMLTTGAVLVCNLKSRPFL